MTRVIVRLLSVTALAASGILIAVGGATGAEAQSVTFDCTGSAQSWVVPANVTSATFDVLGAQGGVGDDGQVDRPSAPAGLGGHTTATIGVTPGETIQINVGCAGSDSLGNAGAPGGFGGSPGGNGGIGGDLGTGGGGGGSSDVRQGGTALTNRMVVAGGGGGSGGANGVTPTAVNAAATEVGGGGDGGGTAGVDGVASANAGGGGGGTQTANGVGGTDAAGCGKAVGVPGADGTDGAGGAGGTDPTFGAGGGGGGGYRSGGGGAGCINGGGGGGGAGFAAASATGVTHAVGVRAGDGQVVVTFTPGTPAAAPVQAQPAFTG
jgi:hypothetical protein